MKLQDPRLEALLEAYRDDRRPSVDGRGGSGRGTVRLGRGFGGGRER